MATHPVLVLGGLIALVAGGMSAVKTRAVLRFQAAGSLEPGSISQWKVTVWKVSGVTMAGMGAVMLYLGFTAG